MPLQRWQGLRAWKPMLERLKVVLKKSERIKAINNRGVSLPYQKSGFWIYDTVLTCRLLL